MIKYICFLLVILNNDALSQTCKIYDLKVEKLECNSEKKFSVKIDFKHLNTGNSGFKIQGNGKVYGSFSYEDLPIILNGLDGNCSTPYEFVVRDIAFPVCSDFVDFGKVCCDKAECQVKVVNLEKSKCLDNNFYKIKFDVAASEPLNNLGYDIYLNKEFVRYVKSTELPVGVIEVESVNEIDTLLVCKNDKPDCCDKVLIQNPCMCYIQDAKYETIDCGNASYFLNINFDHGKNSDSFLIGGSSILYGTFPYAALPVTIGPFTLTTPGQNLLIADQDNIFCFGGLDTPSIANCESCEMKNIGYRVTSCDPLGRVFLELKVETIYPGIKGFKVTGQGLVYGNYQYGQGSYFIGPIVPDCNNQYSFAVVDNSNETCKKEFKIEEKLCCKSCDFGNLSFQPFCKDNVNGVVISLNPNGLKDSLDIYVNNEYKGRYKTLEKIKLIHNFKNSTVYEIKLISSEDCKIVKEYKFNCEELDCAFKDIKIDISDCNDDKHFKINLKFNKIGSQTGKFKVQVNDNFYGPFEYGLDNYSIGLIPPACNGIRLKIYDVNNENCNVVIEKETNYCCEEKCEIKPVSVEAFCFEGSIVNLKFVVNGPISQGFKLFINDKEAGLYKYSNFPFTVNNSGFKEGKIKIKYIDIADPNCFLIEERYINCDNCTINDLKAKAVECSENKFKFSIKFDVKNSISDSVSVFIDNVKLGNFGINQLPIISGEYNRMLDPVYVIRVMDVKNEFCRSVIEVTNPDCISSSDESEINNEWNITYNNNFLRVESRNFKIVNFHLLNLNGQILLKQNQMNVKEFGKNIALVNGIYLIHLENESIHKTFKLIVAE